MPRSNRGRTMGSERTLAQRLAYERTVREWTYDQLARRMTDVGCKIQGSALFKIEKGDPPRRVTVDELVALANVFETPMDELLVPYELILDKRARELVKKWSESRDALGTAQDQVNLWWMALTGHMKSHPESRAAIEAALGSYARSLGYPDIDDAVGDWSERLRREES
jgi:transcriptional regulator with XRE-family HTH domain